MLKFRRLARMTCPAPELLIPHALGNGDAAIARHLEGCAPCQAEVARLRDAAGTLRAGAVLQMHQESPDCLDELAVADFVDGRLAPEVRTPVIAHLLRCAHCRTIVAATGSLLEDAGVATSIPAAGAARPRRWILPFGVAAAAVLAFAMLPRMGGESDSAPALREPAVTTTVAPVPITPRGRTSQTERLVWTSVPHAERYRLLLYASDGALLWTSVTSDTMAMLPASVTLAPGTAYLWKVEAQTEWKRWAASDLVEFRVVRHIL